MFSSVIARRLTKSVMASQAKQPAALLHATRRNFSSSLLVPLQTAPQLPEEIKSYPLTDKEFSDLQLKYDNFNKNVEEELKEMNQNRISNIIERGGVEEWETAEDLAYLRRKFEFSSFEQGVDFVHRVGKFCSIKDHHPQWETADQGKSLIVTLTSHFADNKVTLYDFELAEHMNEQYTHALKQFNMFPWFKDTTWTSFLIYFWGYMVGISFIGFFLYHGKTYPSIRQRGGKAIPAYHYDLILPLWSQPVNNFTTELEVQQYASTNVDDYALRKYLFRQRQFF